MLGLRRINKKSITEKCRSIIGNLGVFIRWTGIAVLVGVCAGLFSTAFGHCINIVTDWRTKSPWFIYFLPLAGILIVFIYKLCDYEKNKGTNEVFQMVHAEDKDIPFRMAPLIFVSTVLTHLFGGSAGREGAALQMGGSIGSTLGRLLKLDDADRRVLVMCGMSAAFSALFGTPMAATIFAMEVESVGIMHYSALVPCALSAMIATKFAVNMGINPESFIIETVPDFTLMNSIKVMVLAILCAYLSAIFCAMLHTTNRYLRAYFRNPYVRIVVASLVIIIITNILGTTDYMGAGIEVIDRAVQGDVNPEAFLMKMILTSLTLGAGFKGGEIVPSFYIGATAGCCLGYILGLSPSFAAALGMTAVFCGVTNCPITAILISFELFGYSGNSFYLITAAIAYLLSGYYGLYQGQRIVYSKAKSEFVDYNAK
jgi:H+/Cl- antiporter ClcA